MDYQEALNYISSVSWKGSVPGLERITRLMHLLGDPQDRLRYVHIAGTNGKGSTAAFLSHILKAAGYKTGLFISPFIEVFNERMQIDNQYITDEELAEITGYIKPFADSMEDSPTEFELNTAIGFEFFSRHHCDVVVLEAGMGGEFDATNVIKKPEAAVITAIGLDHTQYLGDTLEQIAATKAGIIKPGCSVVLYQEDIRDPEKVPESSLYPEKKEAADGYQEQNQEDPVKAVIRKRCRKMGARLYLSRPQSLIRLHGDMKGQRFASSYGELEIGLAAGYQRYNLATALAAVEALQDAGFSITPEQVRQGVAETTWPGRFEILGRSPVFLVDGAHNPHGIRAAADSLADIFPGKKLIFIFGVLADKDYDSMLDCILPLARIVLCVTPDNPRALSAADLARKIQEKETWKKNRNDSGWEAAQEDSDKTEVNAEAMESISGAIREACRLAGPDDVICAIGSLYMISEVKALFEVHKKTGEKA